MSRIKVVLWDIDGTLLSFHQAERYAIGACFEKFHMGKCSDQMLQEYVAINKSYWKRLELGELNREQVLVGRFKTFFEKCGLNPAVAEAFNEEYQLRLGDEVWFCEHGLETVQALKGRVLQYAVTNGTKVAQDRKLARSGLDQLLEEIFISEEIGAEKPTEAFFAPVFEELEKMGDYRKEEILIVGDSLTSDMQGGCNVGIRTCWYHPEGTENQAEEPAMQIDYEITDLSQVLEIVGCGIQEGEEA